MAYLRSSSATRGRPGFRLAPALLSAAFAACGGSAEPQCLPEPAAACAPAINTDFESLHRNIFSKRCGASSNNCHGTSGHQGNLVLADPDDAYKALLGQDGTHARVIVGDPGCSLLLQRLESDDPVQRMPYREGKLPDGLRCAVRMWIQDGAAR